ncbi:MAG TPA: hypothetical protein VFH37_00390 [Candidatus Saccharimonadales bacterium]|nr:hypothetical protein [Candidatus Saccharimonadales bacterium]
MSAKIPPKPGKDVIYIDVDDEITSIIDKVENSKEKVVALVLPKRAASLQSIVNMKLLKRSADQADKNPVLITSEAALMPLAGAAGLHVAKNLQSAPEVPHAPASAAAAAHAEDLPAEAVPEADPEDMPKKIDYSDKSIGALAAAHEADNAEAIALDDEDDSAPKPKAAKAPKDKKTRVPNFDRFRMMIALGALGLLTLIVFIILALFVLPKATVTLTTTSEPVSANFNLTATTNAQAVDTQKHIIPAKVETTDQMNSQSVNATGQQNNGQKASGSVSMTAQKCSGNLFVPPDPVPAGTGISSGGANFITQESASFHGISTNGSCATYASNNNIDITAQAAGSKYNVSNANFTVAGRSDVSGSGSASGGTDNIVTVLSQSDVDSVTQKMTSGSSGSDFTKQFEDKLASQGEYVFVSTLKTGSPNVNASPAVGQPASSANVTVKITYTVLTVKKSDLSQAIEAAVASQIDKTKQKLSGSFLNDADIIVNQTSANSATLAINENTTAVPIIDVASVKKQAESKKTGDIQSALGGWAGVKSVKVDLSPFWVSKAPSKASKIKVILVEAKTSSTNNSAP